MGRRLFDGKDYNDVIRKLEQAWALGCADTEAALLADISSASLCEFLQATPKIAERKARLKETPILEARTILYKAIKKGDGKLALQYLERKCKKEFSTLQKIEGEFNGKVETTDPATEHLKNDIAGLTKAIDAEVAEIEKLKKAIAKKPRKK